MLNASLANCGGKHIANCPIYKANCIPTKTKNDTSPANGTSTKKEYVKSNSESYARIIKEKTTFLIKSKKMLNDTYEPSRYLEHVIKISANVY